EHDLRLRPAQDVPPGLPVPHRGDHARPDRGGLRPLLRLLSPGDIDRGGLEQGEGPGDAVREGHGVHAGGRGQDRLELAGCDFGLRARTKALTPLPCTSVAIDSTSIPSEARKVRASSRPYTRVTSTSTFSKPAAASFWR